MAKLTVAQIRQQIASLEAKAQRIAEAESKASVAKVRALMDSLGVTIEHLGAAVSKKVRAAKQSMVGKGVTRSKKSPSAKRAGAGAVRYRDPETGATWSGFGRAPAWLASAANREDFAVGKAVARTKSAATKTKKTAATKKSATSKSTARGPATVKTAVKKAASRTKRAAKTVKTAAAPAPGKKAPAKKAALRRAPAKKTLPSAPASEANVPDVTTNN